MTGNRTSRYSVDKLPRRGKTRPDGPPGPDLGPEFWAKAGIAVLDAPKEQDTQRIDADVLDFFKRQGKGYQTRINAVLRSYYEAVMGSK